MAGKERPTIIAGNWKMFKTIAETEEFIRRLTPLAAGSKNPVFLAVPFTAVRAASLAAKGTNIAIGAQNMSDKREGAYTGEISASMLKEAGAVFVILGHSERRYIFGEGNRFVNRKLIAAIQEDLQPILCVGETEHEREKGMAEQVLEDQLLHSLENVTEGQAAKVIIAYEPVWAIGTGKTATPVQAQEMHEYCRKLLAKKFGSGVAAQQPILYGGSVKPENIRSLLEQPDIDGALVGGASLSVETFSQIVNYQTINV